MSSSGAQLPAKYLEGSSSFLSTLFFGFLNPLLKVGKSKPLESEDLPALKDSWVSRTASIELGGIWNMDSPTPLWRAIFSNNYLEGDMSKAMLLATFYSILPFAAPALLWGMIANMQARHPSVGLAILYAILFFVVYFINALLTNHSWRLMLHGVIKVHAGLFGLMMRKSMVLSNTARLEANSAKIVNLVAMDLDALMEFGQRLPDLWSAFIQFTIALAALLAIMGPSALAGILVMALVMPVMVFIASRFRIFIRAKLAASDARMKATKDVFQALRAVKSYGWEEPFGRKISAARDVEVRVMRNMFLWQSQMIAILTSTSSVVATVAFAVYAGTGNPMTATRVLVSLTILNMVSVPLMRLPTLATRLINSLSSLRRIEQFLRMPERVAVSAVPSSAGVAVEISGPATFSWTGEDSAACLRDIAFSVRTGELVGIVGTVGCGKSSLLSAILGECSPLSGSVALSGTVAYVSQTPFIANATVRDNIVFLAAWDQNRYERVLELCALTTDLAVLDAGDMTEIGERGINISGGQRARIGLARAVYADHDVVILDDVLSALDAMTSAHIFSQLIAGYLRRHGKTVLLVTHALHVLSGVDRVLVFNDDASGRISETGTYRELIKAKGPFARLVKKFAHGHAALEVDHNAGAAFDTPAADAVASAVFEDVGLRKRAAGNALDNPKAEPGRDLVIGGSGKRGSVGEKLVVDEDRATGKVGWAVLFRYFGLAGVPMNVALAFLFAASTAMLLFSQIWLSIWVRAASDDNPRNNRTLGYWVGIMVLIIIIALLLILVRELVGVFAIVRMSRRLHAELLGKAIYFTTSWIDSNPLGRVMNRFSGDLSKVDIQLQMLVRFTALMIASMCGSLILVTVISVFLPIFLIPAAVLYRYFYQYYSTSGREIQRLESISRSPILSHVVEAAAGFTTIAAFGRTDAYIGKANRLAEIFHRPFYLIRMGTRWLDLRLSIVSSVGIALASLLVFFTREFFGVAMAAVAFQGVIGIQAQFGMVLTLLLEIEVGLTNLERIQHYSKAIASEDVKAAIVPTPPAWPPAGALTFDRVSFRYREGLDLVLRDISLTIPAGHKVGICGRTGAGKSTLVSALLRLSEIETGAIRIDGVAIGDLSLESVRHAVVLVPQAPTLFKGSLRFNLDPLGECTDERLWQIAALVRMDTKWRALEKRLDTEIDDGGDNMSAGERQLVCIARALVSRARVVLLDEASASIDPATDALVQEMFRTAFGDRTVLTIAHRLNTILDSDLIVVLDHGKLAECAPPGVLLEDPNSIFYSMALEQGCIGGEDGGEGKSPSATTPTPRPGASKASVPAVAKLSGKAKSPVPAAAAAGAAAPAALADSDNEYEYTDGTSRNDGSASEDLTFWSSQV